MYYDRLKIHFASLFLLLTSTLSVWGQGSAEGLQLSVATGGLGSSGRTAPFWTIHGQGGRRSLEPNKVWAEVAGSYERQLGGLHRVGAVVDVVAEQGLKPKYRLRQAGVMYQLPWVGVKVGAWEYHDVIDYAPQKSGAMVLSNNSAPIPMVMLYTPRFLDLPWTDGWASAYAEFSFGRFFEDRFNQLTYPNARKGQYTLGTLWHHKTGYLRFGKPDALIPVVLTIGGTHAAHWGGRHYDHEEREPQSIKDFARIVLGKSGGADATISDQINVLGNHYGQYLVQLEWHTRPGIWQLYHQKIFEDKSGIEWSNGADGLWGIHYTFDNDHQWVKHLMVEWVTTLDQSGPFHIIDFHRPNGEGRGGGADSYYFNGEYRSGANYLGMRIGNPLLITPLYHQYLAEGERAIFHSRVQALHFGIGGRIAPLWDLSYDVKLTHATSYGNYSNRLMEPRKSFYSYLMVELPIKPLPQLAVGAELGFDVGDYTPKSLGGGLSVRYTFNRADW
ncbi:MAG: capsule assembly Wzi family protein [Porphyromonas sp.]|nr:capsule assembly Wzi family protein [Porphyromonas sp.]